MGYVSKRISGALFVVFGAVTLIFIVLYWLPGDPAQLIAGDDASPALVARLRAQLGSDQPLWTQYIHYIQGLATGDLGRSFATGESVFSRLAAQAPATLELAAFSLLVTVVLGVILGMVSAVHRNDWIDTTIQSVMLALASMPSFWLGILFILIFSVWLRWLPAIGNGSVAQLMLPVATMGLASAGRLAPMVRNNLVEVLDEPFVATLRAKGLLERPVLYQHVLRSALIPTVTLLGVIVGELLGGLVVIETLFARQGLGRIIAEAIGNKDIPMVQGAVLFFAVVYVTINLFVDLSYRWIDPRIAL